MRFWRRTGMTTLAACNLVVLATLSAGCPERESALGSADRHEAQDCSALMPENPYDDGSGHYAGFEWAESRDPASCGGNSTSFIEGCQTFLDQSAAYEACTDAR